MKKLTRTVSVATACIAIAGCAGKLDIIHPSVGTRASNTKTIDKPRDAVWSGSVPELGKQFFVINNLDKASGLINLSYSGDPENYIDFTTGHFRKSF